MWQFDLRTRDAIYRVDVLVRGLPGVCSVVTRVVLGTTHLYRLLVFTGRWQDLLALLVDQSALRTPVSDLDRLRRKHLLVWVRAYFASVVQRLVLPGHYPYNLRQQHVVLIIDLHLPETLVLLFPAGLPASDLRSLVVEPWSRHVHLPFDLG